MISDQVLVEINPESSRFSKGSEKWLHEREALRNDLQRELGPGSVRQGQETHGNKGLELIPVIVALGGAHAFQALARCLESWLKYRPGEWSLRVTATVDGKEISVLMEGNAPASTVQPFMTALGEALQ